MYSTFDDVQKTDHHVLYTEEDVNTYNAVRYMK